MALRTIRYFSLKDNVPQAYLTYITNEGIEGMFNIFFKEKSISNTATNTRDYASFCIKIARQKNVDAQDFLYACMTSTSFDDLKIRFTTLVPLDEINQENTITMLNAMNVFDATYPRLYLF